MARPTNPTWISGRKGPVARTYWIWTGILSNVLGRSGVFLTDMSIKLDIGFLRIHHSRLYLHFFIAAGLNESFSELIGSSMFAMATKLGDEPSFGMRSLTGSCSHTGEGAPAFNFGSLFVNGLTTFPHSLLAKLKHSRALTPLHSRSRTKNRPLTKFNPSFTWGIFPRGFNGNMLDAMVMTGRQLDRRRWMCTSL